MTVPPRLPSRSVWFAILAVTLGAAVPSGRMQPSAPTVSNPNDPYPHFDIRTYKTDPTSANLPGPAAYLDSVGTPPVSADAALAEGQSALAALRDEVPGVAIDTHVLGTAAVVSAMPGTPFLSGPSDDRVATLRGFIAGHASAYGVSADAADALVVVADELNPVGNMAWVELEQRIHGIPVFQGHVRGAFTSKGELARTNGMLASGAENAPPPTPALTSDQAVAIAATTVNLPATGPQVSTRAWLTYFPLVPGVVRLAWATEVMGDPLGFLIVVDAETGTVVFRKNLTDFQTQPATYHVYTGDSPAPASPSPAIPGANYVAPVVARQAVTRIGNEAPFTFNNNGWIADGGNTTNGNNVEAGIDRDGINGVDAPVAGAARVFNFAYNPGPGSPSPGDDPLTANYQSGEVTNMFYWANRFHDDTYLLGFTEAFRNFQNDNFGRGGVAADRVSAETQDSSGTNNANFSTPADGGRGRMQMFLWTGPTPDRGGGLDADVMVHELAHGLSNRLHANASGLGDNMSDGLGEGWSDFYARALLADASEPVNGLYTVGGWATAGIGAGFESYYYGIRKFPYAISTAVGANGRPHNPLTFADIDTTQSNFADGAHVPNPAVGVGTARDQVHEAGQIWALMLFEARARFITRLGFAEGNRRILQFVTDGMKGDPVNPTFISARDSIIAAANAGGGTAADIADIWSGFAVRGLGVTAAVTVNGTGNGTTRVVESFVRPGDPVPTFSISDVTQLEGNAGPSSFAFTVSLANPSPVTSTVAYTTVNGTAVSTAGAPVGTSAGPIALPAGAPGTTSGPAGPYPVPLNVSGVTGTITKVSIRLDNLAHTFPGDLDLLLVGPGGQKAMFMSDVGGTGDVSGLTLAFEDGAPSPPIQLVGGTFAPTDLSPGDVMPVGAPAGPYSSALSAFNGTNPNGTWSLYVADDQAIDVGSLASFTLILATTTSAGDYGPSSGVLTFPAGTTSLPLTVSVLGDAVVEPAETFVVNLLGPTNAVIGDGQGLGTILNDDGTPPTSTGDTFSTPFDTALTVAAPGVLANDSANGGGALTAVLVSSTSQGTLNFLPTGGFTYTPPPGFAGTVSFTYRSQSDIGLSSADVVVTLTVNQPTTAQPATGLYVAAVDGNRVTLRWTPPAVGPAPTAYVVEGGLTPGSVLGSLPLGSVPIFTFDAPTGSFFVRVHTIADASTSPASNEVPLHVNVPVAPSAPASLLGMVDGSTLSLMWRNTFNGGPSTGAVLDVTGDAATSLPIGSSESISFSGVPGGTYTLSVRSTNAAGSSSSSNAVTLTLPGSCSGAPQTPTRFMAYASGATVHLIWESPSAGAAPAGYIVEATGAFTGSVPVVATSMSAPVPSGTYHLQVRAANACGESAPTAVQTVVIP